MSRSPTVSCRSQAAPHATQYTDIKRTFRYDSRPIHIALQRWDPVSLPTSSALNMYTDMATSAADIVVKSIQAFYKDEPPLEHAGTGRDAMPGSSKDPAYEKFPEPESVPDPPAGESSKNKAKSHTDTALAGSAKGSGGFSSTPSRVRISIRRML